MWEFIKANPFVIGALSGSLAAYLLGLLVSYFRREKRWLGYQVNHRNIVTRGHSQLEMHYAGREIQRLDSHSIQVRNIGNRPLVDVPVQFTCGSGGEIVEHELNLPDGADATVSSPAPDKKVVTFDLLNPGEAMNVGLTVVDAPHGPVTVAARGELLEVKEIGARVATEDLLEVLLPGIPFIGGLTLDLLRLNRRLSRRR